jgi:stage V sporulation protein SpoVS
MKNSGRKTVFAGKKEVYDTGTGELGLGVVFQSRTQDRDFVKFFLPEDSFNMWPSFMTASSINLFGHLVAIAGKDNIAHTSRATMEEHSASSEATINRAIKQLRQCDYIRHSGVNVYMINPGIVVKVDGEKRMVLHSQYAKIPGPAPIKNDSRTYQK